MKLRKGFVSNSSTSSFCVYGVCLYESKIESLLNDDAKKIIIEKWLQEDSNNKLNESSLPPNSQGHILGYHWSEICEVLDIPYVCCGEEGYLAVGLSPTEMNDNETAGQFKERAKNEIKKYFNITEFDWQEGDYAC